MARAEVAAMLREAGYPVVYYAWPDGSAPAFPCIRYVYEGDASLMADNTRYKKVDEWTATLVSERKADAAEEALEAVLEAHGVAFGKEGDYRVESEKLTQVDYTFRFPH